MGNSFAIGLVLGVSKGVNISILLGPWRAPQPSVYDPEQQAIVRIQALERARQARQEAAKLKERCRPASESSYSAGFGKLLQT
eukprot:1660402-Amphidinium_carterae.1